MNGAEKAGAANGRSFTLTVWKVEEHQPEAGAHGRKQHGVAHVTAPGHIEIALSHPRQRSESIRRAAEKLSLRQPPQKAAPSSGREPLLLEIMLPPYVAMDVQEIQEAQPSYPKQLISPRLTCSTGEEIGRAWIVGRPDQREMRCLQMIVHEPRGSLQIEGRDPFEQRPEGRLAPRDETMPPSFIERQNLEMQRKADAKLSASGARKTPHRAHTKDGH